MTNWIPLLENPYDSEIPLLSKKYIVAEKRVLLDKDLGIMFNSPENIDYKRKNWEEQINSLSNLKGGKRKKRNKRKTKKRKYKKRT